MKSFGAPIALAAVDWTKLSHLKIAVKKPPNGRASTQLVDKLKPGMSLMGSMAKVLTTLQARR